MARRATSSAHPLWILAATAVVVLAGAGGYSLYKQVSDPYRTLTPLDVPSYLENSNSLRGNVYKLEGTVANSLAWAPAVGRLFSIEVESKAGADVLPVLIPSTLNSVNIQKGQRFFFRLEVGDQGVLQVQELKKV